MQNFQSQQIPHATEAMRMLKKAAQPMGMQDFQTSVTQCWRSITCYVFNVFGQFILNFTLITQHTHTHASSQWSHLVVSYFNVSCCCVSEYPGNVSVWHLRFFPAFLSALTVPVIYEIMVELRTARWTASLAAALFILGKGLFMLEGLAHCHTLHTR